MSPPAVPGLAGVRPSISVMACSSNEQAMSAEASTHAFEDARRTSERQGALYGASRFRTDRMYSFCATSPRVSDNKTWARTCLWAPSWPRGLTDEHIRGVRSSAA